jgi:16S rRNA (uracil1498-N3)-methyltransferase
LQGAKGKRLVLLIGPEGGFTLDEAQAVQEAGGKAVTLGPRILRAETAAVAAVTVAQYENGDLGGR